MRAPRPNPVFAFLKLALDTEALAKATPFYKAVARQDRHLIDQGAATGGGGEGLSSKEKSRMDDTRSVPSSRLSSMAKSWMDGARPTASSASGSSVVGAVVKRIVATDAERPHAILVRASMTSVVLELVRSDPLETVVRAAISGLDVRFALHEGIREGWSTAVSLADVVLMDVRPKAKGYAYTMILAPFGSRAASEEVMGRSGRSSDPGVANRTGASPGSRGAGVAEESRDRVERRPLIAVKAGADGNGDLDVELDLASFACNLMSEPIEVGIRPSGGAMRPLLCVTGVPDYSNISGFSLYRRLVPQTCRPCPFPVRISPQPVPHAISRPHSSDLV